MRVDQYSFIDQGQATTQASMEFNLPQSTEFGDDAEVYTLTTYDSNGNARNVNFNFSRALDNNQWRMDFTADNLSTGTLSPGAAYALSVGGTTNRELRFNATDNSVEIVDSTTGIPVAGGFSGLAAGDDITFTDTASNDQTFTISSINSTGTKLSLGSGVATESTGAAPVSAASTASLTETLIFSSLGELQSPTDLTFDATWDDGSTSSFTLDINGMTQFDGDFTPFRTSQDGYGRASITDIGFDSAGHVVGTFSDGTQRAIYKVPLYDFTNPNGLEALNGMLFRETEASGAAVDFFADESSKAAFQPNAHELSNVDIAQEFTLMIQTQTAYNMNATTFKTIDEMTTVARDLKA
jgi:flagellar hook protein FlgE